MKWFEKDGWILGICGLIVIMFILACICKCIDAKVKQNQERREEQNKRDGKMLFGRSFEMSNSQIDHTDIAEISLRMDLKHASGSQTKATRTPATDDFSMVEEKPNGPKLIGGESDDMLGLASKANMRYSVEDGISMRASVNLHSSVEGTNLANLAANIAAANQDQTTQNQNPAPGTQLGSGHI